MKASLRLLLAAVCVAAVWPSCVLGKEEESVIGIDLGTTYSCVGIYRNGQVEIVANEQGNRITPSWVAFTSDGETLVGDAAKNQVGENPENTLYDVKRILGRGFSDDTVKKRCQKLPVCSQEQGRQAVYSCRGGGQEKVAIARGGVCDGPDQHEEGSRGFLGEEGEKG